jgi:acid-sensing ion channel, other
MWQKWDESPILMSLDTNNYQLSNVPFPAVTICNVNKVSKSRLLSILSEERAKFGNMSYDTSVEILRYLTKLDRAILKGDDLKRLDAFLRSQSISTEELVNILQRTAPSCRELVIDCAFQGLPKPCMEFFSARPTDDGYCCTFNGGNYTDKDLGLNYRYNFHVYRKSVTSPTGKYSKKNYMMLFSTIIQLYRYLIGFFLSFSTLIEIIELSKFQVPTDMV